ncbi:MAG: hypothetical protein ABR511_08045 [Acidimicrobiales bacterium]
MRFRRSAVALSSLSLGALVVAVPAARAATAPYCGITWGSLDKTSPAMTTAPVTGARVGRHDCYDRLVVDLAGMPAPGYDVRYTNGFTDIARGQSVPMAGGAVLTISVQAPAYDMAGNPTVPWGSRSHIVTPAQFSAGGFRTFRDLAYGGTFEGYTLLGLGVRARLPFRVFTLDGPGSGSRLVVDVAHQW